MSHNDLDKSTSNKKRYMFDNVSYYKVVGMKGAYYIKVSDYHTITFKQTAITLYKNTRNGLIKIRSYIKSIEVSDILFIAAPTIAHNFKMYDLEKDY